MYDVSLYYRTKASNVTILKDLGVTSKRYALTTIHRPDNTDNIDRLKTVLQHLYDVSETMPVVFPVHPRTWQALERAGLLDQARQRLILIEGVGFLDMIQLESNASVILTDSGGVQKEAFWFRVPCITLRGETEWTELVEGGYNRLVDWSPGGLLRQVKQCQQVSCNWDAPLYGDGTTSDQILEVLRH